MGQKRAWILWAALLGVLGGAGCSTGPADCYYEYQVKNQGPQEIRFVTIDAGGVENDFGFVSSGGKGKTVAGCR